MRSFLFVLIMGSIICASADCVDSIEDIHQFWFGTITDKGGFDASRFGVWFGKDDQFDTEIRDRFEVLIEKAREGKLDHWLNTPKGRLAWIILMDQFPRNIYRGTPKAFAYDLAAQKIVLEGIERKDDHKLHPIERVFFYLPLEHAEDVKLQTLSVKKYSELVNRASAEQGHSFKGTLDYAVRHKEIIDRFGRFPHRNTILNRPSTIEEIEFLKTPNSSF